MAKQGMIIVNEIEAHLQKSNAKNYNDFYIGITNDIQRRLHDEHNVPQKDHWFIWREAVNETQSRAVEKHFIGKGMKGGDGGGNETSIYVYCYEISNSTVD
jgi:hypothetical protein